MSTNYGFVIAGWMLMVALVGVPSMGCSSGTVIPDAQPMPEGQSFGGMWYSDQFQHMYLHQEGDRVEGVYGYGRGGTLEGEVDGNILLFSWEEPGDRTAAVQGVSGKGYFQFRTDGPEPELEGQWGYGDDYAGAGPWTAEFIRDIEDDDPRTIEEFFEVH